MNDKNINITGSTITNSGIMNLGEINGNVSQMIQQLPAENNELKTLLSQLQDLINKSTLPDRDKQEALTETKTIAEATTKPKEEQENIVRKTLRYFKGLATDLADIPEIAVKLGVTVAGIASLFGL
jgi:regulator of replication initiation timing